MYTYHTNSARPSSMCRWGMLVLCGVWIFTGLHHVQAAPSTRPVKANPLRTNLSALMLVGKWEQAIQHPAFRKSPHFPSLYLKLARRRFLQGRIKESDQLYSTYIAHTPKHSPKRQRAQKERKAQQQKAKKGQAHLQAAMTFYKRALASIRFGSFNGRMFHLAISRFRHYLRIFPNSPKQTKLKEHIRVLACGLSRTRRCKAPWKVFCRTCPHVSKQVCLRACRSIRFRTY